MPFAEKKLAKVTIEKYEYELRDDVVIKNKYNEKLIFGITLSEDEGKSYFQRVSGYQKDEKSTVIGAAEDFTSVTHNYAYRIVFNSTSDKQAVLYFNKLNTEHLNKENNAVFFTGRYPTYVRFELADDAISKIEAAIAAHNAGQQQSAA